MPGCTGRLRRGRIEVVAREVGEVDQCCRSALRQSEPVAFGRMVEQRRSEPERDGQARRREAERLARVVRWCVIGPAERAEFAGVLAPGHPLRRQRPRGEELDELSARRRCHVERGEVQAVLRRCDNAGLVRSAKGDRPGAAGECRGIAVVASRQRRRPERSGSSCGASEEAAARDLARGARSARHRTTAEVSFDRGSPSESTASASAFTWSAVSSV
jgi:hypothetical protein